MNGGTPRSIGRMSRRAWFVVGSVARAALVASWLLCGGTALAGSSDLAGSFDSVEDGGEDYNAGNHVTEDGVTGFDSTEEELEAAELPQRATVDEIQQRGREAVSRGWLSIPWYDAENDELRRFEVRVPREWSWNWPDEWTLSHWFSNWGLSRFGLREVMWTFVVILLVIFAVVLIRWLLRRESGFDTIDAAAARSAAKSQRERIEALPFNLDTRVKDFLAEASRLQAGGDYSTAIVYLFSHELMELDRLQHIRLTKGKTNRQYLRELAANRPLRDMMERTMLLFEATFFGGHPVGKSQFEACWNQLNEFQRLTEGTAS